MQQNVNAVVTGLFLHLFRKKKHSLLHIVLRMKGVINEPPLLLVGFFRFDSFE